MNTQELVYVTTHPTRGPSIYTFLKNPAVEVPNMIKRAEHEANKIAVRWEKTHGANWKVEFKNCLGREWEWELENLKQGKVMTLEEFEKLEYDHFVAQPPKAITEEEWEWFFECLPPVRIEQLFDAKGDLFRFCMSEFYTGHWTMQHYAFKAPTHPVLQAHGLKTIRLSKMVHFKRPETSLSFAQIWDFVTNATPEQITTWKTEKVEEDEPV
jgi:hypothetical protein